MTQVCSVFWQLLQLFPRGQFANAVKQHQTEFSAKGLTCWEQSMAMLYCQVAHMNSLREVCLGLGGCESPLKHLGISAAPKKSTLAYASANRPWELYESVFMQSRGEAIRYLALTPISRDAKQETTTHRESWPRPVARNRSSNRGGQIR
jgi:hypothetical protein